VAGTVWGVEDLVVEDGEVQGKTQANGVSGGKIGLGNIGGILSYTISGFFLQIQKLHGSNYLVGLVGSGSRLLALGAGSELGEVAVVVTLPVIRSQYCHRLKSNSLKLEG
jgi:hypothetical protein